MFDLRNAFAPALILGGSALLGIGAALGSLEVVAGGTLGVVSGAGALSLGVFEKKESSPKKPAP
jgi:hypothetical protein